MSTSVRCAQKDDLPRVIEIASHCRNAAHWTAEQYNKFLTSENPEQSLFFVITSEDQVNGFLIGCLAADEWEIENIAIDPPVQCTGLGSHLLGEFLAFSRRRGRAVFLEVRESNTPARKLYQKLGFTEAGRRKSYYQEPPEDAILVKYSFS
jgi:[ribosomal protein S18]-alanine N-acetyltransferase